MLKIEPVSRSHNRKSFDCGAPELNNYLSNTARQHSEKGISRSFVLVDAKNHQAGQYYQQFGFIPLPDNPLELFLPLATIREAFNMDRHYPASQIF